MYNLEKQLIRNIKRNGIDIVVIKTTGNYIKYIDEEFPQGDYYNLKTNNLISAEKYYFELLNNGKSIRYKDNIFFKKGYENTYKSYVLDYIYNISKDELFSNLKNKLDYSKVSNYYKMYHNGVIKKDTLFKIISPYLIDIDTKIIYDYLA